MYLLEKDGQLLARMPLIEMEMFALRCGFEPTPAFEPYRALFEVDTRVFNQLEERETPELLDRNMELVEEILELGLVIRSEDGLKSYQGCLLSIDGDRAGFRPPDGP